MRKLDPLDLLRSAYNQHSEKKTAIKLKGTELYFDREVKLGVQTQTAWQSTQTGSLWLILQLHSKRIANKTQYFRQVTALKLDAVGVADEDQIIKYFTGQINTSTCINNQLKQSLSQKTKGRDKSTVGITETEDKLQKKIKTQAKYDEQTTRLLRCIEYLSMFQKPINTKTRSLRYTQRSFKSIMQQLQQDERIQKASAKKTQPVANKQGRSRISLISERKRVPIIIVPQKTIPGNVSIDNIQKFLIKGQYDQKAKLLNPQVSKFQIEKTMKNNKILFDVYCRPELLSQKDWQNVVAVFVIGKETQFDQWALKNHKRVFENSLGYFIKFPKTHPGSTSQWNCKVFTLDPISRIGDIEIVKVIWDQIQKFIFTRI